MVMDTESASISCIVHCEGGGSLPLPIFSTRRRVSRFQAIQANLYI